MVDFNSTKDSISQITEIKKQKIARIIDLVKTTKQGRTRQACLSRSLHNTGTALSTKYNQNLNELHSKEAKIIYSLQKLLLRHHHLRKDISSLRINKIIIRTFYYKYCETLFADNMLTLYLLTGTTLNFLLHLFMCVHTCMYATANMWCSQENLQV